MPSTLTLFPGWATLVCCPADRQQQHRWKHIHVVETSLGYPPSHSLLASHIARPLCARDSIRRPFVSCLMLYVPGEEHLLRWGGQRPYVCSHACVRVCMRVHVRVCMHVHACVRVRVRTFHVLSPFILLEEALSGTTMPPVVWDISAMEENVGAGGGG